jgi:hypothetical protein
MKLRDYAFIYLISLVFITFVGFLQRSPGYMDSEYYAVTGANLLSGKGFTQDFLWNYLDDPQQVSHPSNTYWMPAASILGAPQFNLEINNKKVSLWVLNILFSSLIPVLTTWVAFTFTRRRGDAWLAGLLGLFSGFYLLYYAMPETFAISMVFGSLLIIILHRIGTTREKKSRMIFLWVLAGMSSGVLHMTRAEGLLWLFLAFLDLFYLGFRNHDFWETIFGGFLLIAGYLVISSGWYLRNIGLWHQLFPPGTSRTLWLVNYNQMFSFPAEKLTFINWAKQGIANMVSSRWTALGMNLESVLAVQGGILLLPFMVAGWVTKWRDHRMVLAGIYYSIVFIFMTFVFPFAGPRGGFIHAAAGIQVFLWAMVPVGLDRFIQWGGKRRGWKVEEARKVFQIGLVAIMVLLTAVIVYKRVATKSGDSTTWLAEENKYKLISERYQQNYPAELIPAVMVKNPPGWNLVTGIPAIVIPDGDVENLLLAADKYNASLLILEKDHAKGLDFFYQKKAGSPRLKELFELQDAAVFQILRGN